MSREYIVNKLGMEDFVQTETADQSRNGNTVTITGVFASTIVLDHLTAVTILEKFNELDATITALTERVATLEAV